MGEENKNNGDAVREKLLSVMLEDLTPFLAPTVTRREGKHFEFVIAIGDDESFHVTMTDDAHKALLERNKKG
jgi:hypothetical protein